MSNTSLVVSCPAPFANEAQYPYRGGLLAGRLCAPLSRWVKGSDLFCCLPCPFSDFVYPKAFKVRYRIGEGLNALSILLCVFLLLSYAVLPTSKTRRHYLSVCLLISVIVLSLAFIVPLAVRPDQCYDTITPADMFSNMTCAWSGAFIAAGGPATVAWIFVRALSIHLQICWDVVPGRRFFYGAQLAGWGVVAVIFTMTTAFTGFSFRFADACQVNSKDSMKTFWGPLLSITALSGLIQIATTAYCVKVFVQKLFDDRNKSATTSGSFYQLSHTPSINAHTARAIYHRVRHCLWLQWRSMLIVVFLLTDVVFLSIVYLWMDSLIHEVKRGNMDRVEPFLLCLAMNGKAVEECLQLGQAAIIRESTAIAVLVLVALAGTQIFFLLFRWSMLTGWRELLTGAPSSGNMEIVPAEGKHRSADEGRHSKLTRIESDESLVPLSPGFMAKTRMRETINETGPLNPTPPLPVTTPSPPPQARRQRGAERVDEGGLRYSPTSAPSPPASPRSPRGARNYSRPSQSFSAPLSRPATSGRDSSGQGQWDPRTSHPRGGLAMHPPTPTNDGQDATRDMA